MDQETVASQQRGRGVLAIHNKASTLIITTRPVMPLKDTRGRKRCLYSSHKIFHSFPKRTNKENLVSVGDA